MPTESSQSWSRTNGWTLLSARRHTERATCKLALDLPPLGKMNFVNLGNCWSYSSIQSSMAFTCCPSASNRVRAVVCVLLACHVFSCMYAPCSIPNRASLDCSRGVARLEPTSCKRHWIYNPCEYHVVIFLHLDAPLPWLTFQPTHFPNPCPLKTPWQVYFFLQCYMTCIYLQSILYVPDIWCQFIRCTYKQSTSFFSCLSSC